MAPLDERSARRRDLYLTTQTLTGDKHPCPPVGFEPTIPASTRPQTYALDRAVTGISGSNQAAEMEVDLTNTEEGFLCRRETSV
jgi:hypothetical protein